MPMTFTDRIVLPRGVVARAVDRSTVLLNSQTGRYFSLDDVGSRAWALLIGSPSIQAAYETLLAEFDADPTQLSRDLEQLVDRLASLGLAEVRPA